MSLYDIQCSNKAIHTMIYNQEGPMGAGYYCPICGAVEIDADILKDEALLTDQLRRRIIR
jgi:hypothetical protein